MPSVQKGKLTVLLSLVLIVLYAPILFLVLLGCIVVTGLSTFIFNVCWESRDKKHESAKKELFQYEHGSHAIDRDELSEVCKKFANLNYQVEWVGKFNAVKNSISLLLKLLAIFTCCIGLSFYVKEQFKTRYELDLWKQFYAFNQVNAKLVTENGIITIVIQIAVIARQLNVIRSEKRVQN